MLIQIKSWVDGHVLFELEKEENSIKITLEAAVRTGANLNCADMSGANMSGVNMSGADMSRADMSGVNMSRANMSRADMSWANMSGANMSGVNMSGANMSWANMSWANMSGADMSGANISRANMSGADMSGADMSGADMSGAELNDKSKLDEGCVILQVGPIGSRSTYLVIYKTTTGLRFRTGCFFGDEKSFIAKIKQDHAKDKHGKDYMAAIKLAKGVLDAKS